MAPHPGSSRRVGRIREGGIGGRVEREREREREVMLSIVVEQSGRFQISPSVSAIDVSERAVSERTGAIGRARSLPSRIGKGS
jgi:hypothetical protein